MPEKNDLPACWDLVLKDIQERDKVGQERYGTRLQPFNGRAAVLDLYQELLDAVVYGRQLVYELENALLVRKDWERPEETCIDCGHVMELVAFFDVDAVSLVMECPECDRCVYGLIDWPFVNDLANGDDFRKLGFRVE